MPLRCTRHNIVFALIAVLAMFALPASATDGVGALRIGLAPQSAKTPRAIDVSGTAPAGCLPRIEQVTIDGADVNIALSASATGCKPLRRIPFRLQADVMSGGMVTASVYRVRVYTGSSTSPRLAAFALIDASASSLAPVPESGFWWTQTGPDTVAAAGTGMSLELQQNQLAASLLGFAESGASSWLFGSTPLNGRVARIPLVELANGEDWFSAIGTRPNAQSGPRLEIEFLSPTRARAYLVRGEDSDNVQVRPLLLSRTAFATGAAGTSWVGRWVLIREEGGEPRMFDFAGPTNRDADSFRLTDTANDAVLDCRLVSGTQQADACTLSTSAATIGDFDQVGFDHFSGHSVDGAPIQLLRVPR